MITFTRFLNTQLFQTDPGSGDPGYMAYFTSAVLDPSVITITVNQSWDVYIGFYIFLKAAPAAGDLDKFTSALTSYFAEHYPAPEYTGFAWLEYLSGATTINKGTVLNTMAPDASVSIANDVSFNFANYALPLKQFAPVVPITDFDINIVGFTYEYPPYDGAPVPWLLHNNGAQTVKF